MNSSPEAVPLTSDGKRKLAPVYTAGGAEIVYAVHESPTLVALMRLKRSGGGLERLHPNLSAHQFDPAYSPDGRFHAFALSASSPQLVLVMQDAKTARESTFRAQDSRATARCPSWLPDGSRVVFSLSDVKGHQIASVDNQGGDLRLLTQSGGINAWPAVSPDGRQIAFSSSRTGDFEIYVMNADGGESRPLTRSPGMDVRPAWSPDGARIAFTSRREGNYDVFVMNADGSQPRNLTRHADRDDFACWRPDGRAVLFVSERGGRCELYEIAVA